MIDYFFKWTDEAAAKADAFAVAQKFQISNQWATDHVLPNVQAWRPSQDVGGVHTFLTGWFAIVSLQGQAPVLLNAAALQFALNRDGPPYIVKNNIGAIISDVGVAPVFAGSHYPIGGFSSI